MFRMNKVNALFKKWDQVVKKYETASDKIQKEIAEILSIRGESNISNSEMRSLLDESGNNLKD